MLVPWMNRAEERRTDSITHVQRQISFKKELEVEELKTETPETLYALPSLESAQENHVNSSLKVSNMIQI